MSFHDHTVDLFWLHFGDDEEDQEDTSPYEPPDRLSGSMSRLDDDAMKDEEGPARGFESGPDLFFGWEDDDDGSFWAGSDPLEAPDPVEQAVSELFAAARAFEWPFTQEQAGQLLTQLNARLATGPWREILARVDERGALIPLLSAVQPGLRTEFRNRLIANLGVSIDTAITGQTQELRAQRALGLLESEYEDLEPEQQARFGGGLVAALAGAVARRSGRSPHARKGILGVFQAVLAGRAIAVMTDEQYDSLIVQLALAQSGTERAFVFKALAVWAAERQNEARQSSSKPDDIGHFVEFARFIRGGPAEDLVAATTCIDIGRLAGAKQTFTDSCAPTCAIMGLAEASPVFALQLRTGGDLSDLSTGTHAFSELQREALDSYNVLGTEVSRPRAAEAEIDEVVAAARDAAGPLTGFDIWATLTLSQRAAVGSSTPKDFRILMFGLQALAKQQPARAAKLFEDIRDFVTRPSMGLHADRVAALLANAVAPHLDCSVTLIEAGPAAVLTAAQESAELGIPAFIGVEWAGGGAHAMLISDCQHHPQHGLGFLVSDPWTGQTAWLAASDLAAGRLTRLDPSLQLCRLTTGWQLVPRG